MAQITSQAALNVRQNAEDAKYRKLTERALKIVVANRPYSHPYIYDLEWAREASAHANDEWYVTALMRQADTLGVEIPDELRPSEGAEASAPARRHKRARRRCNASAEAVIA